MQYNLIGKINFYAKDGVLKKLELDSHDTVAKEIFLIGDNEQLIACKYELVPRYLVEVTFLKWTIAGKDIFKSFFLPF